MWAFSKHPRWRHMKPHWCNSETNFGIPECCSKVAKHLRFWVELPLIKVNAVLFGRASHAFWRSVDVLWAAKAANQTAFPSFSAVVCGFAKVASVVSACSLRRQCLITDLQRPYCGCWLCCLLAVMHLHLGIVYKSDHSTIWMYNYNN